LRSLCALAAAMNDCASGAISPVRSRSGVNASEIPASR
jgi:hypothetical protein